MVEVSLNQCDRTGFFICLWITECMEQNSDSRSSGQEILSLS
jgi:hypothetical protein